MANETTVAMSAEVSGSPARHPPMNEHEALRLRIKDRIHAQLSKEPKAPGNGAWIVLYNWARGKPASRGFSPRKKTSGPYDYRYYSIINLLRHNARRDEFAALLKDEPQLLSVQATVDFTTWAKQATDELIRA